MTLKSHNRHSSYLGQVLSNLYCKGSRNETLKKIWTLVSTESLTKCDEKSKCSISFARRVIKVVIKTIHTTNENINPNKFIQPHARRTHIDQVTFFIFFLARLTATHRRRIYQIRWISDIVLHNRGQFW